MLIRHVINPWLAGKPILAGSARGLLRVTNPLYMRQTKYTQFSRTLVKRDFVTPYISGMFFGPVPMIYAVFTSITWLIGHCYNVYPWFLLLFLVMFLMHFGSRVADYDRGQMLNLNLLYIEAHNVTTIAEIVHSCRSWRQLSDHSFNVTPEEAEASDDWVVDRDGAVEPSPNKVSPAGLAAYHLLNSMSLRWDVISYTADWNDSWCRRAHLLMIQPSWLIGGGKEVHSRVRTYVGDWTDESYPWSRSSSTFSIPYTYEYNAKPWF
eukprot:TRINITY_DN0_c1_g1_i1.p1 TRINITY_DN0_c1_g1~~TRINITY_DN0_c1_g1_i1.p1  ORF type:complete len:296 (+),score=51.23 TRINITY_DN0_c1_g1_i1:95-889(+)